MRILARVAEELDLAQASFSEASQLGGSPDLAFKRWGSFRTAEAQVRGEDLSSNEGPLAPSPLCSAAVTTENDRSDKFPPEHPDALLASPRRGIRVPMLAAVAPRRMGLMAADANAKKQAAYFRRLDRQVELKGPAIKCRWAATIIQVRAHELLPILHPKPSPNL
jgi:hypothetical protein